METEIIQQRNDPAIREEKMIEALDQAGATEDFIAWVLVDAAENAYTVNNWEISPDYASRINAVKEISKLRWNKAPRQINIQNIFGSAGRLM